MDSKIDRLKTWIYSQEGVTINSLAKRLSCPVDILIVKVKQLTKIQPKNTDIIPRTYLITNLDSILRAVDSIHEKANIKPSKSVQKEYKSAKKKKAKVKVIQNKILLWIRGLFIIGHRRGLLCGRCWAIGLVHMLADSDLTLFGILSLSRW